MEMQNPVNAVKKFDFKKYAPMLGISFVVVVLGVLTGWLGAGKPNLKGSTGSSTAPNVKVSANEAGILDESTFEGDTAEGKLVEGGIGGEGTHHLERAGGPTKDVYLTSSVIDLESFVGKDVTVWGQTLSAKKAGWLMDVVKVKSK